MMAHLHPHLVQLGIAIPSVSSVNSIARSDAAGALCCYDWVQGCFVRINLSISDFSWEHN